MEGGGKWLSSGSRSRLWWWLMGGCGGGESEMPSFLGWDGRNVQRESS